MFVGWEGDCTPCGKLWQPTAGDDCYAYVHCGAIWECLEANMVSFAGHTV